jgi:hypothetical protein
LPQFLVLLIGNILFLLDEVKTNEKSLKYRVAKMRDTFLHVRLCSQVVQDEAFVFFDSIPMAGIKIK